MKYIFTEDDRIKIEKARKLNRDKQTENRLKVLSMRCVGKTQKEIAEATGFVRSHVCDIIRKYFEQGLSAISEKHYQSNHRNMSFEEEAAFLEPYKVEAEQGHILCVKEIAIAYEQKVGHKIGAGQIYRVLKRHEWRKVMPRSKHPDKASDEAIEASKKLKLVSRRSWRKILTIPKSD